jgi:hypothetical protein
MDRLSHHHPLFVVLISPCTEKTRSFLFSLLFTLSQIAMFFCAVGDQTRAVAGVYIFAKVRGRQVGPARPTVAPTRQSWSHHPLPPFPPLFQVLACVMSGYYCMLMLYHSFLIMQRGAWGRRLHNISTKELCFVIYSMTLTMGSVTICSILAQHEFDGYKVTSTDLLVHDITMIFYAVSRVVPLVMTVSSVARVDTHPFTATYACRGPHPTSHPPTHTPAHTYTYAGHRHVAACACGPHGGGAGARHGTSTSTTLVYFPFLPP